MSVHPHTTNTINPLLSLSLSHQSLLYFAAPAFIVLLAVATSRLHTGAH